MTTFLDNLNLRPQERRLIVVVGLVVFILLNWWFVYPHFGDWKRLRASLENSRTTVRNYVDKINEDNTVLKKQLRELEQEGGPALIENDIQLQRTIYAQANEAKVVINNYQPVQTRTTQTNEFFEEQSGRITIESEEKPLVDFLFKLGQDSSMIRVRDLNLKPGDVNRYKLRGTITLSANYQKKAATPAAAAAKAAGKPGAAAPATKAAPEPTKKSK